MKNMYFHKFQLNGHLNVFIVKLISCVLAMLIALIFFVSRHYETLNMQLVFFSENVLKLVYEL